MKGRPQMAGRPQRIQEGPGPGHYELPLRLTGNMKLRSSHMRSAPCLPFETSRRATHTDPVSNSPGPTAYSYCESFGKEKSVRTGNVLVNRKKNAVTQDKHKGIAFSMAARLYEGTLDETDHACDEGVGPSSYSPAPSLKNAGASNGDADRWRSDIDEAGGTIVGPGKSCLHMLRNCHIDSAQHREV